MRSGDLHDALVFCAPCILGGWVADVIFFACARTDPPVEVYPVDGDPSVDDFGRTGGAPRVFLINHPGRIVMDAVAQGQFPTLVVLDDPVDSVRYTKVLANCDILQALRVQTAAVSAHHLFLDNPAVAQIQRGAKGSAHDLIARIIDLLGLALSPQNLQALLETFGGPVDRPWPVEAALQTKGDLYQPLDQLGQTMSADDAGLVRQVLSPMVLGAVSHDIGPITWVSRVFLFGDRPDEVAPAVADVTGAARILYYGPYFHLPPGTWKVRIIVAFSQEASGTPFKLTVYCDHKPIARIQVTPTAGGAFEGLFTMQHLQPEHHLEIHFSNEEGTIEGHMALGQVGFTRLAG